MLWYLLVFSLASIFCYIGNNEYYRKGWLLVILSIGASFGAEWLLPLGFLSPIVGNVALYLVILLYNIISNREPRSGSGF